MRLLRCAVSVAIASLVVTATARAQRRPGGFNRNMGSSDDFYVPPDFQGNPAYDGRFTFARIKYRGFAKFGREGPGWSHDYPRAEENFMRILRDITVVRPFVEQGPIIGSAIIALDDPLLFKYPVSYMSEPGGWFPNDAELAAFRTYVLKGGFMIFDDFREAGWGGDWTNLRMQVARAMPNAKWFQMNGSEPIFDSFFKIDMKSAVSWPSNSAYGQNPPTYWAVYQDNDPKKRLLLMANVDNDIGESWQWSGSGFVPVSLSNETFKLGVNYIIYALTH
jgi:hypothetical protein